MGGGSPAQKTDEAILEDKYDTDPWMERSAWAGERETAVFIPGVEPPKVICHQWETEARTADIPRRPCILSIVAVIPHILGGNDLL